MRRTFVVGASREGRCHQQAADAAAPTINCFTLPSNLLQSSLHRRAKYRWVLRSSLRAWPQRLMPEIFNCISVVNPIRDLIWRSNSGQRMMLRNNNGWASREMAAPVSAGTAPPAPIRPSMHGLRAPFQDDNLNRDSEASERQDFTGLTVSVWNPQRQHRP
jgi:hypothetical protein